MKSCFLLLVLVLNALFVVGADWLTDYNVEWTTPSERVDGSMPLGAGDIGCNVWVEKGELMLYIQRSGSFNEIGEYIKMGRLRVSLKPNPFVNYSSFSQKLILKDGYIQINAASKESGVDAKIKLWVDQYTHSVHCTVDGSKPIECRVAYETWRTYDKSYVEDAQAVKKGSINTIRWGSFAYCLAPFEVTTIKDTYGFDGNKVFFYHKNPTETLSPNFGIKQQGLEKYKDQLTNVIADRTTGGILAGENFVADGTSKGKYVRTNFDALRLKSEKAAAHHHFYMVTHVAQERDINNWRATLNKSLEDVEQTKGNFIKNLKWWNDIWSRSWIVISPEKKDEKSAVWQVGRNYNLMRYVLAGNAYGEFPTKFNGGSLTFDLWNEFGPDWRKWGGDFFTAQNQRLVYWPLLKSGDFDMMAPQFNLYMKALPGSRARVKEHFGHEGAMFSENVDATGLHLPYTYGWNDRMVRAFRGIDVPFGDKRMPAGVRPGVPVEKGLMISPSVALHFQCGVEHAYMMLMYYKYCGIDIKEYMPMIKDVLIFYDKHYRARQKMRNGKELDKNGKLLFEPSQGAECFKPATNPVDVITALRATIKELLQLDRSLLSKKEKKYFEQFLEVLPPITYGEIDGKKVIKPAMKFGGGGNKEKPMFYPLFPYNQYSIDDREINTFINTWNLDPIVRKDSTGGGWAQDGIFLAHMGLAHEAMELHKIKMGDSKQRRFPTFWGPNYDGIPDINHGGSGMIGVQDMLMQCQDKKILLLPAWPKDIDVNFKLHAPYNTTVEVEYKKGVITKLEVVPKSRKKDVIVNFAHKL